ncbi:MAG: EAL domain-containing protein [Gammaproteobacteria bacterium]|nr:EAL domain-containing protein [Gammaproteobacteria bacterium]MCW8992351.1 EAL domain-containing protein [Gammaproteobacteria bacterium]
MDIIELIHNTAMLVALVALYQLLISRRLPHTLVGQLTFGLLLGLVAVVGMMDPLEHSPGIIFDGRSIIIAIAGYIGGPLVALVSAVTAAAYRAWLGGGGAPVGIAVIAVSAAIGVYFHYLRKKRGGPLGPLLLFGFGLVVQLAVLGLFTFLPDGHGRQVISALGTNILLFYPLATMLIALLFEDYEAQERTKQQQHYLAYHDSLSGLPNRSALLREIGAVLQHSRPSDDRGALLLLNIDRFKRLNDARGHTIGDALLRAVGQRLSPLLSRDSLLARLSADEFACLIKSGAHKDRVEELSEAIHHAFRRPLSVGADEFAITISAGIATFPMGGRDTTGEIMRRADTALHHAKRAGGNRSAHFADEMARHAEQQLQMERELRSAVEAGELRLFLQSQVDGQGHIVGAEALVRWQHPQQGLLAPGHFIPIAEESDLIVEVDRWVINQTCRLLTHRTIVESGTRLSVNISPRHFHQPGFSVWLRDTLVEHGADPRLLTLEITEGLLIENLADAATKMRELAAIGLRFSVDDFGTGYSSLAYLKQLPIHELKIDKIFIQDAPNDATLVEAILAVAERLRLNIVAEGVETAAQAALLSAHSGVYQQGYLYNKPEPEAQWLQRLQASRP